MLYIMSMNVYRKIWRVARGGFTTTAYALQLSQMFLLTTHLKEVLSNNDDETISQKLRDGAEYCHPTFAL